MQFERQKLPSSNLTSVITWYRICARNASDVSGNQSDYVLQCIVFESWAKVFLRVDYSVYMRTRIKVCSRKSHHFGLRPKCRDLLRNKIILLILRIYKQELLRSPWEATWTLRSKNILMWLETPIIKKIQVIKNHSKCIHLYIHFL